MSDSSAEFTGRTIEEAIQTGLDALGLERAPAFPSPLPGPKGNREFFLHCLSTPAPEPVPKGASRVDLDG